MTQMKMAIVSSYSESCGNSAFTKVLHDSIEHFYSNVDVEVVELDLTLLQSIDRGIRSKGDKHIKEICDRLKHFDSVNIQMEAGLYGTIPNDITKRFSKLVKANKNTSVTLHSPRLIGASQPARSAIKKLLKLNIIGGLRELISDIYAKIHFKANKKIVKLSISNHARIIVHTLRAKKQIDALFTFKNIDVHPLKIVGAAYVHNPKTFENLIFQTGLGDGDVLIGMFGYISAYKGHKDALNALKLLPAHYKLLIFGRQHPQTIKSDGAVDRYLKHLIRIVSTEESLKNRVLFLGELSDQDFLDVATDVDVAWLPYYENGQDGSGIASLCVDLCPRVLCSTSFAFDELFKLVSYNNVMRFDIGNTIEIAKKTQMILSKDTPVAPYDNDKIYNIKSQANVYVKDLVF